MTEKNSIVVAVTDEYTIAINRGSVDGVKLGDKYLVYGMGSAIKDPVTGEDLGQLELVRGRAKVVHVQDRLSTLKSDQMVTIPGQTRRIKREGYMTIISGGPSIEEIEEGVTTEMAELTGVAEGDHARPI